MTKAWGPLRYFYMITTYRGTRRTTWTLTLSVGGHNFSFTPQWTRPA